MPGTCSTSTPPASRYAEQGIALILVVGVLAIVTVMVVHLAATTRVAAAESKVLTDRERLRYAAESAAERAFWLYYWDRRKYPSDHTNLTRLSERLEDPEEQVWRADGRRVEIDLGTDDTVSVTVRDADHGLNISGRTPEKEIRERYETEDFDENLELEEFLDKVADYVDSDWNPRINGMERADYEAEGVFMLPRNAAFEHREELFWVPGYATIMAGKQPDELFVPDTASLRVIPPTGQAFPSKTKPSLFASDEATIRRLLDLEEWEGRQIMEAIEAFKSENTVLRDSLDPEILQRLLSKFSVGESGVVTVTAAAVSPAGIERHVQFTRDCRGRIARRIRKFSYVTVWEQRVR